MDFRSHLIFEIIWRLQTVSKRENDLNSFMGQKVERAIYLVEIIHNDVCDLSSVNRVR